MRREPVELPPLGEGLASRTLGRLPGARRLSPRARAGVSFVALALLVGVALVTGPWGFLLLGVVIGGLVASGVPAAEAGLKPLAALGRAAVPLALPLFVFVAAGVVNSPGLLQLAVGVAIVLGTWIWLIKPEAHLVSAVFKKQGSSGSRRRTAARVGPPTALALAAAGLLIASLLEVLGESDQSARSSFAVACYVWVAAIMLRLIAYGRTAFRAVVAVAGIALLARLAIDVGILGQPALLSDAAPGALAVVAGGALALTVAVEIVTSFLAREAGGQTGTTSDQMPGRLRVAVFLETPVIARSVSERTAAFGLLLAVVSALLLVVAVYSASRAGGAEEDPESKASRESTGVSEKVGNRALAEMFSPVLLFTKDQRWTPIAVDDYVRDAEVRDWEGRVTRPKTVNDLDTDCPGVVKSPCHVLTQSCPPVERKQTSADDARCAAALSDDKRVYVRVARRADWAGCKRGEPCADGSPNPFAAARGPYARQTETLVQYWYFYPFNEWVAPVVVGDLKQIHAADWEAVTVGLSADRPLWVAYSAHCGGSYAPWARIRVAESDPKRLRPLVAVAHGSQANYRVARESRVPNFAECSRIQKDRLRLASYAANIRDRTDDSVTWDPGPEHIEMVSATTPPMSFPGRWAPYNRMTLENFRDDIRLGKDTGGPESPPLQALWQSPMRKIFGGGPWTEG